MSRGGCLGGAGPLIAALAASLALGVFTTVAEAHAVLLRVIPSANQQLQSAPAEIRLLFSEPVDPRFSSVAVVDATGAGDAFDAAFLARYLHDGNIAAAARFANEIGSWVVARYGARPPSDSELEKILAEP